MCELFAETQVLCCKFTEQISDNSVMMRAGGGAYIQNTLYIKKHNVNFCLRYYVHIQHRSGSAGIGGGKGLSGACLGDNIAVAPDVFLNNQNTSRQDNSY